MMFDRHGSAIDWSVEDGVVEADGSATAADNEPPLTKSELTEALKHLALLEDMLVQKPNDEQLENERLLVCMKLSRASEDLYDISPFDRLKAAVDRFQRAEAAHRIHPKDAGIDQELKMAEHAICRAQWAVNEDQENAVLVDGGTFITDLKDDRLLVVRMFIQLKLKKDQRAAAKHWMAERGRGTNTKKIYDALFDAFREGEPLPVSHSLFGVIGGQILIMDGPSLDS
jgi:hypothetical protein